MALPAILLTVIALLLVWLVLVPWFGLGSSLILAFMFTAGIIALIKHFIFKTLWFPIKGKYAMYLGLVLVVGSLFMAGWFSWLTNMGMPAAITAPVTAPTTATVSGCKAGISAEILGTTATLDVNAWNLESNTPYSSAKELGVDCWVYKNGNTPDKYVTATTDTTSGTVTGFSVGDTVYIYCGGNYNSPNYTEPLEGVCVDQQRKSININTHAGVATTNLEITGYDDTGSTTLGAGALLRDYNLTLGAGEEKAIFLKLRINVADLAFNFGGWSIARSNTTAISNAEPKNTEGRTYAKQPSRLYLSGQSINRNSSLVADALSQDYTAWTMSSPLLMKEWESIKDQFTVKSAAGQDPITQAGPAYSVVAFLALDSQYAKGGDGAVYLDYYIHDSGEGNPGLQETLTSPEGKDNGILLSVI